jgi:hypothetical protein
MSARRYAQVATALFALVVVFQLALVAGAPLGAYTQGGANEGTLPSDMRLIAGASAMIVAAMALTVLANVDLGPLRTASRKSRQWAMRATTGYAGVAVLANLATRSPQERAVWAPISIVLLICCIRVLQNTKQS